MSRVTGGVDGIGVGEVEVLDLRGGEEGEALVPGPVEGPAQHVAGVSPRTGVPSRLKMSQNTRATGASSGCQGRIWNVFGSGRASTSLSWTRREAVDGRPVEGHALLEGVLELGRGDAERLGGAEHVGEPELHEADGPLLDRPQHVVLLASHVASAVRPRCAARLAAARVASGALAQVSR